MPHGIVEVALCDAAERRGERAGWKLEDAGMSGLNRRAQKLTMAALMLGGCFAVGCSMPGKWSLAKVEPTAATRDAEFHSLTLQKDGTFYAEANEPGGIKTTSGTYTYEHGVLDLIAHDGERHTYDATFRSNDDLRLARMWQGRRVELKYDRQDAE